MRWLSVKGVFARRVVLSASTSQLLGSTQAWLLPAWGGQFPAVPAPQPRQRLAPASRQGTTDRTHEACRLDSDSARLETPWPAKLLEHWSGPSRIANCVASIVTRLTVIRTQ